jgi:hypothetical protein
VQRLIPKTGCHIDFADALIGANKKVVFDSAIFYRETIDLRGYWSCRNALPTIVAIETAKTVIPAPLPPAIEIQIEQKERNKEMQSDQPA